MAEIQATCLYDFDGDVQNGELTFYAGDVLTIIRQDIGDGWWEARNARGEQGLIPETYVEIASIPEPAFPPPPPPSAASMPSAPPASLMNKGFSNGLRDSWGGTSSADTRIEPQASFDGWDDDDWEDQDDDASSNSTMGTTAAQRIIPLLDFQVYEDVQNEKEQGQGNFGLSTPKREKKQISPTELSRYGTVKSSFSRFSQFAKSGGEAFMTGQLDANVPDSDRIKIIDTPEGPCWQCPDSQYTCSVASPKKESKMKGLKSYIAYQLTPSFSNIQVSRRYKHFDWLHERLLAKFPCIPIPPLPDKQVTGRYEEDFVQERMKFLQMWVDRMVRHPVICRSDVFLHFLTCTDGKKWKQGKRKAEKDEFQGFKFFLTLDKPQRALEMHDVDAKMEVFCKFVYGMNENAKQLYSVIHEYAKKQIGPFKREYSKIGSSFKQLALTFNLDTNEASKQLTTAIDRTGDAYNDIGIMFERQPSVEAYPFLDSLLEYKGLLQTYPDVLKVHEGTVGKAKECLKLQEEGKIADDEVHKVLSKADTISYGTLAEMNHFQRERVKDFKLMMQLYLRQQIGFYKDMTKKLENALQEYDSVNIPR